MLVDAGRVGREVGTERFSEEADDVVRVFTRLSAVEGATDCRRRTRRRGSSFDCSLLCPLAGGTGELDRVSKEDVAIGGCSSEEAQVIAAKEVWEDEEE